MGDKRIDLGQRVRFRDQFDVRARARLGVVVGRDPFPPQLSKRSGICLVIRPDGADGGDDRWQIRQPNEVEAV